METNLRWKKSVKNNTIIFNCPPAVVSEIYFCYFHSLGGARHTVVYFMHFKGRTIKHIPHFIKSYYVLHWFYRKGISRLGSVEG